MSLQVHEIQHVKDMIATVESLRSQCETAVLKQTGRLDRPGDADIIERFDAARVWLDLAESALRDVIELGQ